MNYSKEVVHFFRMVSALQSSPSNNPTDFLDLVQRSQVPSRSHHAVEPELLYNHIEPTTLHGMHFQEDISGVNGSGQIIPNSSDQIMQIFWTVMFATMLSLACLGNIIVIWIVLAHRRMRTVTNYFLLNLSVADLTMASLNGAPNSVYMLLDDWIFGNILCIVNNFVANFTVASCVFTMTAISIDRYMAIVRPLQPRMTKKAAWRAIAAIWVCSVVLALPNLIFSKTETFPNGTRCFLYWPDGRPDVSNLDFGYNICLIIFVYFIPMIAMAICYGSMSKELWGHRQIGEVTERQINSMISKRKVVRMFIVIVFLFAICWAPYHLYFIYASYDNSITWKKWVRSLYLSFYFLAMSTSMVNPIIYYLMNTRFRNYIQQIVSNFFFCRRRRSSRRRDFIGETPPLFRRYSQSYSRSRSGTGDENVQNSPHPKAHCNLVLQSHLHYYHHPTVNHHAQQTMGTRHQMKRLKSPHGAGLHRKTLKTGSTYC